jgi:hypothetical protein
MCKIQDEEIWLLSSNDNDLLANISQNNFGLPITAINAWLRYFASKWANNVCNL